MLRNLLDSYWIIQFARHEVIASTESALLDYLF